MGGVWDAYVLKYPAVSPYCNKGWVHWETVLKIMPSSEQGTHVFHPTATPAAPTTPPASQANASPAAPTATLRCVYSEDDVPEPVTVSKQKMAAAPVSQSAIKSHPSGAAALEHLSASVGEFGAVLREAFAPPPPPLPAPPLPTGQLPPTPRCKMAASERAEELEYDWLSEEELAVFMDILRVDVSAADTYSVCKREASRKAWVRKQPGI
ncbi:hypothetical protein DXG01_008178 [Tephrocybe rancida]|nr:hypothetical protein DXG01_008178 [Tephrocybe rancida]